MKNRSNIFKIVLIILAVILLGLILFFTLRKTREEELISPTSKIEKTAEVLDEASEVEEEGERILLIPKEEVYSFSITDAHGIVLDFQLIDDKWVYVNDDSFEINQDRIDKLLNYITDIRFIDVISTDDGEEYGLNQESPIYEISDANNNSTIISIGKVNKEEGTVYFAINYDFTKIYVNQGKLYNIGAYTIQELIQ
jgi:hypothetical protein